MLRDSREARHSSFPMGIELDEHCGSKSRRCGSYAWARQKSEFYQWRKSLFLFLKHKRWPDKSGAFRTLGRQASTWFPCKALPTFFPRCISCVVQSINCRVPQPMYCVLYVLQTFSCVFQFLETTSWFLFHVRLEADSDLSVRWICIWCHS